jgi:hypothetical protein
VPAKRARLESGFGDDEDPNAGLPLRSRRWTHVVSPVHLRKDGPYSIGPLRGIWDVNIFPGQVVWDEPRSETEYLDGSDLTPLYGNGLRIYSLLPDTSSGPMLEEAGIRRVVGGIFQKCDMGRMCVPLCSALATLRSLTAIDHAPLLKACASSRGRARRAEALTSTSSRTARAATALLGAL